MIDRQGALKSFHIFFLFSNLFFFQVYSVKRGASFVVRKRGQTDDLE